MEKCHVENEVNMKESDQDEAEELNGKVDSEVKSYTEMND